MKTRNEKMVELLIRIVLILAIAIAIFIFAIRPMFFKKDYYFDSSASVTFANLDSNNDKNSYDVAVIGDSINGIYSAIAAAGVGAKTLLVCPDGQLGDNIRETLDASWSLDISPTGKSVSSDIYKELRYKAGEAANIDNYIQVIKDLVSKEKKLEVLYNTEFSDVTYDNGSVSGLTLKTENNKIDIKAKRYIDATRDGDLLQKCNVQYTNGYGDIGIDGLYPPAKLNFMVSGVDYSKLKVFMQQQSAMISLLIKGYNANTTDNNISITGFNITDQGNSNVIVEAVTMRNVNLNDQKQIDKAYAKAKIECNNFYNYLKSNVDQFKTATGVQVAQQFITASPYHFEGRYMMTLTDALTGKRFSDRISTVSRPVTFTMQDGSRYILCNPKIFYIPLRSLVPKGLENVLMTGDKISTSSLVQTVIGSNSSKVGTGYAAGIIAAYSISKNIEISKIVEDYNLDTQNEIEKILRKLGIYMSDTKEDISSITGNWSFAYLEKLNNLGLLSAGLTNDFKYDKEAKSQDLAYIVLNGVPRVSKSAYSYAFDIRIRQYLTNEPLTKEVLGKILLDFNGKSSIDKNYYSEACKLGLIDKTLQQKLENKKVLRYSDVYYAAVQLIEKLTRKQIESSIS